MVTIPIYVVDGAVMIEIECWTDPEQSFWYIVRSRRFSVPVIKNKFDFEYLHTDGVWRISVEHNKSYSGRYSTPEAAELILKSFEGEEIEYRIINV